VLPAVKLQYFVYETIRIRCSKVRLSVLLADLGKTPSDDDAVASFVEYLCDARQHLGSI
jgi:hypothetical protein